MRTPLLLALLLTCAAPVAAQSRDASHWGVSVGLAPRWTFLEQLTALVPGGTTDGTGSDFRIGLVRGRDLGGEWGVSLIRKNVRQGSVFIEENDSFCDGAGCVDLPSTRTVQQFAMTGVLVHKYVPFATIKRRAQVGLTVAGGVASVKGTIVERQAFADFDANGVVLRERLTTLPARDLYGINPFPLAQLELTAAALIAPGLKARVSGGLNFPGTQRFALSVSYLLGAR